MVFSNKEINNQIRITINENELERVNHIKFLGVIIDCKMTWKPHILNVQKKVSKTIAILYKLRCILNKNALHLLYSSLVTPYLTYGIEIWGNTYKTRTNLIFLLQKKVIRLINYAPYNSPSNSLFLQSKILKFYDLVDLYTAKFIYQVKHNKIPKCLQILFTQRESNYNLRGLCIFNQPQVHSTLREHCLSNKGVKLWNSCCNELKQATSIFQFKNIYKRITMEKYSTE